VEQSYEAQDNFRPDRLFTLDCDMWPRIIDQAGGVVSPHVLSSYRTTDHNASSRLARTGETLTDRTKLTACFKNISVG
jgi:hypothetical protein